MTSIEDAIVTELQALIKSAGEAGGVMSPSVYDSCTVARHLGIANQGEFIDWIISQQAADGGWGQSHTPSYREIPTMSALLALRPHVKNRNVAASAEAGLEYLTTENLPLRSPTAQGTVIPAAAEIIGPWLHTDLRRAYPHAQIPRYTQLESIATAKRRVVDRIPLKAGTPWLHIYEATQSSGVSAQFLDGAGSIGHSPSATAAWLSHMRRTAGSEAIRTCRLYLRGAAAAVPSGPPGRYPVGWPHTNFEISFLLYALVLADHLTDPRFDSAIRKPVAMLQNSLKPTGIGMSDYFQEDGDDTSATLAILHKLNIKANPHILSRFRVGDHFSAYPGELQSSLSVTARCAHTLALYGAQTPSLPYIAAEQGGDGRWLHDKWNRSWLYVTLHCSLALQRQEHYAENIERAVQAVLKFQNADGGWGDGHASSLVETSYAVFLLIRNSQTEATRKSLERALSYMRRNFVSAQETRCWASKELYRMYRVDRAYELSALLALESSMRESN